MKRAWAVAVGAVTAAALTVGTAEAQPKLLTNAQVDTHSAAAGLEGAFHALLTAQPQPAWIGYAVPSVRVNVGCDYVNRDAFGQPGVIHLEPPAQAVILFRIEANAVDRVRTVSPDCEIDGGGVPMHWLNDVNPAQSVALLAGFVGSGESNMSGAMNAIAVHEGAAADQALDRFAAAGEPQSVRLRAVSGLGWARGRHGFDVLKALIANDPDDRVCERAVSAVGSSKEPEATDLLISIARTGRTARVRAQAVGELARKPGPKILPALSQALEDQDPQVQRRAVTALREVPDGGGIPLLIQVVKTSQDLQLRKDAMNSLRNSRDPRALAFFEDVLK